MSLTKDEAKQIVKFLIKEQKIRRMSPDDIESVAKEIVTEMSIHPYQDKMNDVADDIQLKCEIEDYTREIISSIHPAFELLYRAHELLDDECCSTDGNILRSDLKSYLQLEG